jgi:hypothetical protein
MNFRRWMAVVTLLCVVQFVCVYLYVAASHPGGSSLQPDAVGYDPRHNTLTDLGASVMHDGDRNPSAGLFNLACVGMLTAVTVSLCSLPALVPGRRRTARWVAGTGVVMILGLFGAVLLPGDAYPKGHSTALGFAAAAAIGAAGLLCSLVGATRPMFYRVVTALVAIGVLANVVLYANCFILGNPWLPVNVWAEQGTCGVACVWCSTIAILLLTGHKKSA